MESKNCCIHAHSLSFSVWVTLRVCVSLCFMRSITCHLHEWQSHRAVVAATRHGWVVLFDRVSVTSYLVFSSLLLLFSVLSFTRPLPSCINRSRHWTLNEGHQRQLHWDCFFSLPFDLVVVFPSTFYFLPDKFSVLVRQWTRLIKAFDMWL